MQLHAYMLVVCIRHWLSALRRHVKCMVQLMNGGQDALLEAITNGSEATNLNVTSLTGHQPFV